ncbi:lytic transglycosylase domain-containing protein [Lacrimispora sp.]|uniref:lytic transglycosylase domain-containing protein n=1 Tax=Lacrimispora sp. TaxID=2719234 RepID=UPI0028AB6A95|nr:lytic transglycosylase domain-containing protein [Lacrimispora sp.]
MATIDQLKLSALASTKAGQSGYTAASSAKGNFKQILKSVAKAPENLEAIFSEASKKYGVSEKLLKAVAKAESNFNPSATSKKGAAGVMQLMPATARSLGVDDPYDARSNIMGGAKYLKENLDRYKGNVDLTLAAYNAGSNNVSKYGGIPPFKETQEYVKKVKNYMGESEVSGYSSDISSTYEYLSNLSLDGESGSLVPAKSDYLYLIELMKLRMQMASFSISNQFDSADSTTGSIFNI